MLTKRLTKLISEITYDGFFVYIGGEAYLVDDSPLSTVSYNSPQISAVIKEYATKYHGSVEGYREHLEANIKPNILSSNFVQIKAETAIDLYTNDCGRIKFLVSTDAPNFQKNVYLFLKFHRKLQDTILDDEQGFKQYLVQSIVRDIIPVIKDYSKIANKPNEYGLAYFPLDKLPSGDTPAWDSFIGQIEPEFRGATKAWLYSLFLRNNRGRQVIWFHGQGQSGKTSIANVIGQVFSAQHKELVSTLEHKMNIDKFTMSGFENAALVIISDSKERRLVASDVVKSITGGDTVALRGFNKAKRSAQIYSKIMVTSNYAPSIDTKQKHELSRILYVPIDAYLSQEALNNWDTSKDWAQELHNEFWMFIEKCKVDYYENLEDDRNNIKTPKSMVEKLSQGTFGKASLDTAAFLEHNCNFDISRSTPLSELQDAYIKFLGIKKSTWRQETTLYNSLLERRLIITYIGAGSLQLVIGIELNDKQITRKELQCQLLHSTH